MCWASKFSQHDDGAKWNFSGSKRVNHLCCVIFLCEQVICTCWASILDNSIRKILSILDKNTMRRESGMNYNTFVSDLQYLLNVLHRVFEKESMLMG